VIFSVSPGDHILQGGRASLGGDRGPSAAFTAEAGRTYYFRMLLLPGVLGSWTTVTPIDENLAREFVANTTAVGAEERR